jgi:cell division protein YceG involved in septum cleavage
MFSFFPIYKKNNNVKINVLILFFQFTINVLVKKYEKGGASKTKNKTSSNASIEVQEGNQVSQIESIKRYWHS